MKNLYDLESCQNSPIIFNTDQVQNAVSKLEKYITLMQNNNRLFKSGINLKLNGDYTDTSIKRSTLIDSEVANSVFTNTALTGSFFSNVVFLSSSFDEANLQYCQFINNNFQNISIHSSNLSYSNFYNTEFVKVTFKGSTVSELLFDHCTFEKCLFTSSMLENAVFINCVFKQVEFSNTNIEYMELKNCKLNDVLLPMAQVPYVFGLFQSLMEPGNNIKLWTDKETISLNEYKSLKESLTIYYASISEFFPLANIYLAGLELENAYDCIVSGIKQAMIQHNFRMLKFFCKQAKQGNLFEHKKMKELYILIEKYASDLSMDIYEQKNFIQNIVEIRSILLDNFDDFPTARIELQTNIDSSESGKIINFIEYIDDTICKSCTQKISHIEYRHNSDANFIAYVSAHYLEIILILHTFLLLSNNVVDSIQKKIINHQQIVLNKLEIEAKRKNEEEIKQKRKDLEKNNIKYTMHYIVDNPIVDSHDINIYL